jgi:hypothetical protein
MTPPHNDSPFEPPGSSRTPTIRPPVTRPSTEPQSVASSIATLPYRNHNASVSSLFASTSAASESRLTSPTGAATNISSSVFGGTPGEGNQPTPLEKPEDPRNLILHSFVPHIAIHTSLDTRELVKDKGFEGGLWELLRPFGEHIPGKVMVRDSVGAGKVWDDFVVRFVQLGDGLEPPDASPGSRRSGEGNAPAENGNKLEPDAVVAQRSRTGGDISQVENLVDRHLTHAEQYPTLEGEDYLSSRNIKPGDVDIPSTFYTFYLRRLLSGLPLTPHETFSHPVACIIAISSRNTNPIESLRKLYDESSHGPKRLPIWVNNDYLRYYVLVHDEEGDDITKSIALFDQMKRHFGLHCHLLRLRSSHCVASDDDSVQLPRPEWLAATEESLEIQRRENQEDMEDSYPCLYESDTTAIKSFIREMVTQSVIPSMERNVATWNDQVASRRRGMAGRLLKISKWTGFGGSRASSSNGNSNGSNSNYSALQGFYRPDTPEALMRKLADYAFMLRDWKLAQSTYELLRSDFSNDKAWKYHAAANEMAAISTLMIPQAISSKVRSETVDQMLETATYSYITRCGSSYGALRALTLGMELLRLRGGSAADDAARWGSRILDNKIVGVIGEALIKERISTCYASKFGSGTSGWGSRTRKSVLWSILAADAWLTLGKPQQARLRLDDADERLKHLAWKDGLQSWSNANAFLAGLRSEVILSLYPESAIEGPGALKDGEIETEIAEETSEPFVSRPHRRSLMGVQAPILAESESKPLRGMEEEDFEDENSNLSPQLQFE